MFKRIITPLVAIACYSQVQADVVWETDYEKASQLAEKEGKLLLIEFTGSDWCPPCMMMKKEVLSKQPFIDKVKDKFVLLELDFPKDKEQSEELKEQNKRLSEKYGIQGYPTIIFARANGNPISRFVGGKNLEGTLAEIDKAIERSKSPEGEEAPEEAQDNQFDEQTKKQLDEFENAVGEIDENDDTAALTLTKKFLERKDLTKTTRHIVLFYQGTIYLATEKPNDALKNFEESAKLDTYLENEIKELSNAARQMTKDEKKD